MITDAAWAMVSNVAARAGILISSERTCGASISFAVDGLPALPFFTKLARRLSIPLSAISVEHIGGHMSCETCGHGPCEFTVTVQL